MAERTTPQKAPEEGPQQAETTKREVVDITGNAVRAPELRYTAGARRSATSGSPSTARTGRHAGTP